MSDDRRVDRPRNLSAVAHRMGDYVPVITEAGGGREYADWIDYRASLAHSARRADLEELIVVCHGCGTETDTDRIAHSPRCPQVTT